MRLGPTASRKPATLARSAGAARGFTLLETSLALVIIGVGVLAFVDAQQSFIRNNSWSSQAATAAYLANEIREFSRRLPRHDPVIGLYIDTENGNALIGWGLEGNETDISDINDVDDLDGLTFGAGGFPGPINALGELVPQIDADGKTVLDQDGVGRALDGWFQSVHVEKVDALNYGAVRADNYKIDPSGNDPGTPVDGFPLRVTVVVSYQGAGDSEPVEVTRAMWIVPP